MTTIHAALKTLFERMLTEIRHMDALLQQESDQLQDRDAAGLEKTSQIKEQLAGRLNELFQTQQQFLNLQKRPSMDHYLTALPANDPDRTELHNAWQEISRISDACHRLNDMNGAYIGLLRQHVQRSLDILHDRTGQDMMYGPDGIGRRPAASRKLLSV